MDIIRQAEEKDYWNVLELENTLHNQNAKLFPDLFKQSHNTVSKENFDKEIMAGTVFVFEHDGEIIGFYRAHIFEYPDDETTICQKMYFIHSIVVKENHQRKKLGTKLFQFIENQAKEKGCKTIELNVWENNSAINFYKKMGMEYKYHSLRKKISC
jgi:GNAT superfamily N-acetyltransferase